MAIKSTVISPSDRITQSFKKLADSAAMLNLASDELGKAIEPIDAALKKLNLGVEEWYRYSGGSDPESGCYWSRGIGYARVGRKWGLALEVASGEDSGEENSETWLFNDAPRWMRIEALDHIPELLERLVKKANKVAEEILKKSEQARELAATISALSAATGAQR